MIDFRGRVSDMYKYRYLLRCLFSHDYLNSPERQAQTVNNHVSYASRFFFIFCISCEFCLEFYSPIYYDNKF